MRDKILARFQKKAPNPKQTRSIRFDKETLEKAQKLNLNISAICRDALDKALSKVG